MQPVVATPPTKTPLPLVLRSGIHPTAKLHRDSPARYCPSFTKVHDKFAATIKSAASGDYDVPDTGVPIFSQSQLGSCVLNSSTRAMMVALFIEQQVVINLSRLFAYWLCSKAQGTLGQDTGTEVALAVERYGSIGVCDEAIWPYTDDPSTFFKPPPGALESVLEGSDNRPTAWFKVDESDPQTKLAQMETALRSNHTIVFGSPVSSAIQNYTAGQILGLPDPNSIIGGHSMTLTGIRSINGKRCWKAANSWSASWGGVPDIGSTGMRGGYCLIGDDWAADPEFSDLWIMTRMDKLLF